MFILCSVNVNGTTCSTLAQQSINTGMERAILAAAGNHQGEFVSMIRQVPRCMFTTRKIDLLSAPVLGSGNCIFRQVDEGGTGSSTYISVTGTNGAVLIIPRRISWAKGQPGATLACEMIFLSSDGSTAPLTVGSTSGALTAEADVWHGDMDQVSAINIDFGWAEDLPQDGRLYAKHSFFKEQRPSIELVTYDDGAITTTNLNPGSISTLTAILAKIADGGVRGTQKQYALNGHLYVGSVDGDKPGTVRKMLAGTGTFTIS